MEHSDSSPATPDSTALTSNANATNRRRSGRVTKKPEILKLAGSAKRKRSERDPEQDMEDDASGDESIEDSEGEADEEELKEKRRSALKPKKVPGKPVAKKTKMVNGASTPKKLAMRPAPSGLKNGRKSGAKPNAATTNAGGLYADVFTRGQKLDEVSASWITSFEQNNADAVRDLVNLVLKSTGCGLEITSHDIEDPDNVTSKLTDLQDEYQAQNITDYPLISKAKGNASFRPTLVDFFHSFISAMHASSILYNEPALIENIQLWISTMSSSAVRPFRHTATLISLTIMSSLCDMARDITDTTAKTTRQMESEKKKGRVNRGRVAALEEKMAEGGRKRETVEEIIKDFFDTVFVHRYRDVDPKIRAECVQGLGHWITTFPDCFFEGQYLRYLGWVLSDTSAPTRHDVVKQLQKLFKDKNNIGGLRTFTERFRSRLVEMATRDAEATVRASTVELLDLIREAGLLEPDDIDAVGRLIFDSEARVRKAVVGFFAENINDLYESKLDDLGGEETVNETVASEDDEDFDHPRISWLKLKCLVEVLQSYDSEDREELPSEIVRGPTGANDILVAAGVDSRFSLAAQALYEKIPEVQEWEILAGYLLWDHSEPTEVASNQEVEMALREVCKLDEKEEAILLEVLNAAVKLRLSHAIESEIDKKGKSTKARKQESLEIQETAARHLAQLIPRLLNKFGAVPEAASVVLRLEHVLNLQVFQELRQDSTTYSSLLDDIKKQFLTHTNQKVLVEASAALLHARSFEELEEVTEGKVQSLWEDTISTLHALVKGRDLSPRGNLSSNVLTGLSNTVKRVGNLASISNCVEVLETVPVATGKTRKRDEPSADPITILIEILQRGAPGDDIEEDINTLEDELVMSALKCLLFYFMWKMRFIQTLVSTGSAIPDIDIDALQDRKEAFITALTSITRIRPGIDDLRLAAAGTILDLYTLFATLRHSAPTKPSSSSQEPANEHIQTLIHGIPPDVQRNLTTIYTLSEKFYAKKSRRALEAGDHDEPLDSDAEDSDDEGDDESLERERWNAALMAEQRLCEFAGKIVLAIIAKVLDASGPLQGHFKERLSRNRSRLGQNFKEVVAHLDEPKAKSKRGRKAPVGKKVSQAVVVQQEEEEENDEDEAEEARQVEEGEEADLRARELVVEHDSPEAEAEADEFGDEAEREEEVEDDIMGD
ncbi:MAG: hypothetical protein M1827_001542 [Pycnora praestabilis]|nr:MAG: hypothetical protein M1827_001542 [Pycnora praestabilis]